MYIYKKTGTIYRLTRNWLYNFLDSKYVQNQRVRNRNFNFTIISNNCWGGRVYEDLDLEYKTPTIGLFFFSNCYIKFIQDLKNNLSQDLNFVTISKYEKGNLLRQTEYYPIGIIGDGIEIHFLHYKSEAEAKEKWERRKGRVNYDNLYFSFTDNEKFTMQELEIFDALPYPKVFFSSKKIKGIKSLIWLNMFSKKTTIGDIYTNPRWFRKYFDATKWLNQKQHKSL